METQKPFILIGFRQEKMKKNIILSTAAILAGCLFISSCDVAGDFIAPKDTWVYKDSTKSENSFTYTWGEGENKKSVNFDLYVNYATKDAELLFNNAPEKTPVTPGLNVILVPSANNDDNQKNYLKELLNRTGVDNIAMFKSFGEQSEASASESDTGKSISLSGIWTLVYNFNRFESMGSKSISNTVSDLTLITDVKNLNWKRVLYNMLGDKLFSEN
ncbi:MAG: hypothetical protein MR456_06140 [Spirochaetia bacterium]|nr:hypothetical protein [Spirochaetia bacterium]